MTTNKITGYLCNAIPASSLLERALKIMLASICIIYAGCVLFDPHVTYVKRKLLLLVDKPAVYNLGDNNTLGSQYGNYPGKKFDTVISVGYTTSTFSAVPMYIIAFDSGVVYLQDCLPVDEYIFRNLTGSTMSVPDSVDATEWSRALAYVAHQPGIEIEVSSNNLIQTKIPRDTTLFGYSITRTPYQGYSIYSITCNSRRKSINVDYPIRKLSFFMLTGREYGNSN